MIVANEVEIPDECGNFCPVKVEAGYPYPIKSQGDICTRCPVFNCGGSLRLIEPKDYDVYQARFYLGM